MTRIRIITMALFAVLCVSAVSASGAMAAKKAELVKSGTTVKLTKTGFTATGGEQKLETISGANVKCKKASAKGTVLSTKEATQSTVTFTECKNSLGQKCKSSGAAAEEIVLGEVSELLGYLVGSSKEKLALKSTVKNGTTAFKFECSTVVNEAKGSFVVAIGATQEKASKTSFAFSASEAAGVQGIKEFETAGGTVEKGITLEAKLLTAGASFEQAGQEGTETVTLEEAAEFI